MRLSISGQQMNTNQTEQLVTTAMFLYKPASLNNFSSQDIHFFSPFHDAALQHLTHSLQKCLNMS